MGAANLRHLGKQLVVIGLLEVHLVVDGISHLSLIPLLNASKRILQKLTFFPLADYNDVRAQPLTNTHTSQAHQNNTYHIVINLIFETIWWWL